MAVTDAQVLEVLYRARERVSDEHNEFYFSTWHTCTCGHIYTAATGHAGTIGSVTGSSRRSFYGEVLVATAQALGARALDVANVSTAAGYVSDATKRLRGGTPYVRVQRRHAVAVINDAISVIEQREQEARRDVLAAAERIVENAEVEVALA